MSISTSRITQAVELLEQSRFNWVLARGKMAAGDPLYTVEIVEADDHRITADFNTIAEAEGDDPFVAAQTALNEAEQKSP